MKKTSLSILMSTKITSTWWNKSWMFSSRVRHMVTQRRRLIRSIRHLHNIRMPIRKSMMMWWTFFLVSLILQSLRPRFWNIKKDVLIMMPKRSMVRIRSLFQESKGLISMSSFRSTILIQMIKLRDGLGKSLKKKPRMEWVSTCGKERVKLKDRLTR
mgnify:CR=1 FL=1